MEGNDCGPCCCCKGEAHLGCVLVGVDGGRGGEAGVGLAVGLASVSQLVGDVPISYPTMLPEEEDHTLSHIVVVNVILRVRIPVDRAPSGQERASGHGKDATVI